MLKFGEGDEGSLGLISIPVLFNMDKSKMNLMTGRYIQRGPVKQMTSRNASFSKVSSLMFFMIILNIFPWAAAEFILEKFTEG